MDLTEEAAGKRGRKGERIKWWEAEKVVPLAAWRDMLRVCVPLAANSRSDVSERGRPPTRVVCYDGYACADRFGATKCANCRRRDPETWPDEFIFLKNRQISQMRLNASL